MTATPPPETALCGLGPMGAPIASRLLESGHRLTVWNRTAEKALPYAELGAHIASSPADAAAPVVLTVLPDLAQVEDVVFGENGLLEGWRVRRITSPTLVVHGTTSPTATASFASHMLARHDVHVVDAPLSGGTQGAAAGTLSIMLGGDQERARSLTSLFRAYGRVVTYFGPSGAGALAKACNQIVVASTVAAVSEAVVLAEHGGLDVADLFEVLEAGLAGSEVIRQKKSKWIEESFAEGGSGTNQLKDLRFVHAAAEESGLDLTVVESVRALFERMVERGEGDLDHTAVIRTVRAGRDETT
jgi:2-hydroxy-3-oxopropionate reductase